MSGAYATTALHRLLEATEQAMRDPNAGERNLCPAFNQLLRDAIDEQAMRDGRAERFARMLCDSATAMAVVRAGGDAIDLALALYDELRETQARALADQIKCRCRHDGLVEVPRC